MHKGGRVNVYWLQHFHFVLTPVFTPEMSLNGPASMFPHSNRKFHFFWPMRLVLCALRHSHLFTMLMVLPAGPNILEFVHTLVFSKFNGRKCNNWTNERIMFDLRRNTVGKKYRVKKESEIRSNFNHENDEIRTYLTLVAFFINPGHIEHRILWKPIALLFRVWFSVLFAFAVCHHCFHCNAIRYRYVHTNMYKTFFMVSLYKKKTDETMPWVVQLKLLQRIQICDVTLVGSGERVSSGALLHTHTHIQIYRSTTKG